MLPNTIGQVVAIVLLTLVVTPTLWKGSTLVPVDRTWTKSFIVQPTGGIVMSGDLYMPEQQVDGFFTVRSCCGYATDDIRFSIGLNYVAMRDYGVVVDSLTFSWNTGQQEKYSMFFDNGWGQVCDENGCHPDTTHPSSHNKTVELFVRETAPGLVVSYLPYLFPRLVLAVIAVVATVVGVGLVASGIVIAGEKRRRGHALSWKTLEPAESKPEIRIALVSA